MIIERRGLKHGMCYTRFYGIWRHIRRRCKNPNAVEYPYYGGRGIKCLWNSFEEFRDDMYGSYKEKLALTKDEKNTTIDRIDNDGNYCKENCRWATIQEQMRNMRRNRLITYKGKTQCIAEWAIELGLYHMTLRSRLGWLGWSVEKAFETPIRFKRK